MDFLIISAIFIFLNITILIFYKKISKVIKIYDYPDKKRKLHSNPTPILGGVILFINILLFYFFKLFYEIGDNFDILYFYSNKSEFIFFVSLTSLFFTGLFDDKYFISANKKLFISFIIFFIATKVDSELIIKNLNFIIIDRTFELKEFGIFFTAFCFLSLLNALNMFDGINLQLSLYSFFIFLILFLFYNFNIFSLILIIPLFFIIVLNYNGKIFLGDGGVFLIAFCLTFFLIKEYNSNQNIKCDEILLLLLYPGMDMIRLFTTRLIKGINPFTPDRNHIHHILSKKFNYNETSLIVILSYTIPILLYLLFNMDLLVSIVISIIIYIFTLFFLIKKKKKYFK